MIKQVNTQKSTNNPMSSFGFIEENMELSHIHLAVSMEKRLFFLTKRTEYLCISIIKGNNYALDTAICKKAFRKEKKTCNGNISKQKYD
jgi:hypothetical protein